MYDENKSTVIQPAIIILSLRRDVFKLLSNTHELVVTQLRFTFSNSVIETLEKGVKYSQS